MINNNSYLVLKRPDLLGGINYLSDLNTYPHHHVINPDPLMHGQTLQAHVFYAGSAEYDELERLIQNRLDKVVALTLDQAMEVGCRMSQELQELMDEAKEAGSNLSGVQDLINDFDQLHKRWVNGA
ncbi:MAG TPA: hypothetical protein VIQ81_04025 [Gammaproteobacteria bacterium]